MLRKNRHPNLDFFVADLSTWSTKDDHASMEHPFFSLTKKRQRNVVHYVHGNIEVEIRPDPELGMPTIWDKDILIFCTSQLIEGIKQGREPKREIVFGAYDFLTSTNRSTGLRGYDLIIDALKRLSSVRIFTNIETGSKKDDAYFPLIGEWEGSFSFRESSIRHIKVELPNWLYRAVLNLEVLTLSHDYFRLDGGLERRVYEICRKHCGNQAYWSIGLDLLRKKSGSRAPIRNFRIAVKKLVESNYLPEYRLSFDAESDKVQVYARSRKGGLQELKDVLGVG